MTSRFDGEDFIVTRFHTHICTKNWGFASSSLASRSSLSYTQFILLIDFYLSLFDVLMERI